MINIEQHLSSWKLDGLIGRGSYGEVYRIKKEEMGYAYYAALKVIKIPSNDKEVNNLRFMGMTDDLLKTYYQDTAQGIVNEIRIMESLKSAGNIVHIEEHSLIPNERGVGWTILIRMELLETIRDYQSRSGVPDVKEIVKIGTDICTALGWCEDKKIIHRDVKPDNIFRSEFGEYKLGDFGIAKMFDNTVEAFTQKGTLGFIAPEVYRGEKYDQTVDLYSLGLMLYIYLNRQKPPFIDVNNNSITAKMLEDAQWKRISGQILPPPVDAPPGLASIVLKACHPNPRKRYQSAHEFKRALEVWERDSIDYKGSQVARRNREKYAKRIIIGLCVFLSLGIFIYLFFVEYYYPGTENDEKPYTSIPITESDSMEEGQQSQSETIILVDYYGKNKDEILNNGIFTNGINHTITNNCRFSAIYTDKNVQINDIVKQFPAYGTEIDPFKERVSFYYSKGDLTNDQGYSLKADSKEIHMKKGERTSIVVTLVAPNGCDEGYIIANEQPDVLILYDTEWHGNSFTFDIGCLGGGYKSGMIQFCYLETKDGPKEGCYCDVYYTVE